MKNMSIYKILAALALTLAANSALAFYDWSKIARRNRMPTTLFEIAGAYKGVGIGVGKNKNVVQKTSHMIIVPLQEDGVHSGRFNIFILYNYELGNVFEGYVSSETGSRVVLRSVQVDSTGAFLDFPMPVGTLTLEYDGRTGGAKLAIAPANGSTILNHYEFTKESDDLWIGPLLPMGTFRDDNTLIVATPTDTNQSNVRIQDSKIGVNGEYISYFELTGMMVLRSVAMTSSGNEYPEDRIAAVMVSIVDKSNRAKLIVAPPSADGSFKRVQMINLSR